MPVHDSQELETVGMTTHLLAQLGWVFEREAEAIRDSYAWPPRAALTAEERAAAEYFEATAEAIFAGCSAQEPNGGFGTDYCFGKEIER
jgi:hypothetical protein